MVLLYFLLFYVMFFLVCLLVVFFFFFFSSRRRHTRFDCDWSSDVCSSDLARPRLLQPAVDGGHVPGGDRAGGVGAGRRVPGTSAAREPGSGGPPRRRGREGTHGQDHAGALSCGGDQYPDDPGAGLPLARTPPGDRRPASSGDRGGRSARTRGRRAASDPLPSGPFIVGASQGPV